VLRGSRFSCLGFSMKDRRLLQLYYPFPTTVIVRRPDGLCTRISLAELGRRLEEVHHPPLSSLAYAMALPEGSPQL
jgi:hypothetical protein